METNVVVILPYIGDKVLIQLRDNKRGIPFPGHWGFFGGSIDEKEQPKESALRELKEELGFEPNKLDYLETVVIAELNNLRSHAFYCMLTTSLDELKLTEGMDFGLFTIEEVMMRKLYSHRMKKSFPVIPYLARIIHKLWEQVSLSTINAYEQK